MKTTKEIKVDLPKKVDDGFVFTKYTNFEEWKKELHKDDTWLDKLMYATWWPFYRFCADLNWKYIKGVKRFIQRGYRGYADSDLWSLDSYLARTILSALIKFKGDLHGHPCTVKSEQEWLDIVNNMIYTFDIEKGAIDDEVSIPENYKEYVKMKKFAAEMAKNDWHIKVLTAAEHKKYLEGWKLFQKYFRGLWD